MTGSSTDAALSLAGTGASYVWRAWVVKFVCAILLFAMEAMAIVANAQESVRTPLPNSHPLIGRWIVDLPQLKCFEEYEVRTDGTRVGVSGQERNLSEFTISPTPSAKGFYTWTDKIVKSNGKPDCSGSLTEVGHLVVRYVRVHPSGSKFLLCEAEDMNTCFIEFNRKKGSDT